MIIQMINLLFITILLSSCTTFKENSPVFLPKQDISKWEIKYQSLKKQSLDQSMLGWMLAEKRHNGNLKWEYVTGDSLGYTGLKMCSYLIEGDLETAKNIWYQGILKSQLSFGQFIRHNHTETFPYKDNPISRDHVLMGVIFSSICIKKFSNDKKMIISAKNALEDLYRYGEKHEWLLSQFGIKDRIKFAELRWLLIDTLQYFNSGIIERMYPLDWIWSTLRSWISFKWKKLDSYLTSIKINIDTNYVHFIGHYEFHLLFISMLSYQWMGYEVEGAFDNIQKAIRGNPLYAVTSLVTQKKSLKVVEDALQDYPSKLPGKGQSLLGYIDCYRWSKNYHKWDRPDTEKGEEICGAVDFEFLYQLYRYYSNRF